MGLLRMRMDALHYALLAVVVLLAVYCGASFFREVETVKIKLSDGLLPEVRGTNKPLGIVPVPGSQEVR